MDQHAAFLAEARPGRALSVAAFGIFLLGAGAAGLTLWNEWTANAPDVPAAVPAAVQRGTLKLGVERVPRPPRPTDYQTRREEGFEAVLRDDLQRRLNVAVELVPIRPEDQAAALAQRHVDVLLVHRLASADADEVVVRTGYESGLTFLMRSDTTIRSWADAAKRSTCIVEDNEAARAFTLRGGGSPLAYADPAKALAAMRAGECDAAVVDSTLAAQFAPLERWRKFGATLPARDVSQLVFKTAPGDRLSARRLQQIADAWHRQRSWQAWTKTWATEVDFEAYLEQDAPDCH
ncbi:MULTISPECIES: transporter substrate-binding domain-containing protein [unclassified Beijerinckia]|uniref:transporter substrate-binding domain-containing protein n=1 Tax=unclassified Beijerinckia TaxID=2638183 RepID=UPI00147A4880|nr:MULTISPECIES: transporter substrate-binding domain-containing protein [unclassified Beijerinckia]